MAYLLADIDENNIGKEDASIIGSYDKTVVVYSLPTDKCVFQARTTVPPYRVRQLDMRSVGDSYNDDGRTVTAFGKIGSYCDTEFPPTRAQEFPLELDRTVCGFFRFSPRSEYERDMKKRIIAAMAKECPQR